MFYTALANFDEKVFDNPFRFIAERKEKPLSFGTGMHMCIGMGITLSFASSFIAHINSHYMLRDVSIIEFAEGVSAPGASDFNIGIDFNELAEN